MQVRFISFAGSVNIEIRDLVRQISAMRSRKNVARINSDNTAGMGPDWVSIDPPFPSEGVDKNVREKRNYAGPTGKEEKRKKIVTFLPFLVGNVSFLDFVASSTTPIDRDRSIGRARAFPFSARDKSGGEKSARRKGS